MQAFADHGEVKGDRSAVPRLRRSEVLDDLERVGISYDEVVECSRSEGVEKFEASWDELVRDVKSALEDAKAGSRPSARPP